jgi:vacuolar-type H+-ATPase subunit F/Vma7
LDHRWVISPVHRRISVDAAIANEAMAAPAASRLKPLAIIAVIDGLGTELNTKLSSIDNSLKQPATIRIPSLKRRFRRASVKRKYFSKASNTVQMQPYVLA